jgi:hypothetical protein
MTNSPVRGLEFSHCAAHYRRAQQAVKGFAQKVAPDCVTFHRAPRDATNPNHPAVLKPQTGQIVLGADGVRIRWNGLNDWNDWNVFFYLQLIAGL